MKKQGTIYLIELSRNENGKWEYHKKSTEYTNITEKNIVMNRYLLDKNVLNKVGMFTHDRYIGSKIDTSKLFEFDFFIYTIDESKIEECKIKLHSKLEEILRQYQDRISKELSEIIVKVDEFEEKCSYISNVDNPNLFID